MGQICNARSWRAHCDRFADICRPNDQGRRRVLQDLTQPVAWIARINCYERPYRRQASQQGQGEHRTVSSSMLTRSPGLVSVSMYSASPERPPLISANERDVSESVPRHGLDISAPRTRSERRSAAPNLRRETRPSRKNSVCGLNCRRTGRRKADHVGRARIFGCWASASSPS